MKTSHGVRILKMDKIPLPLALDLKASNKEASWKLFLQMWNNYEVATDLSNEPDNKRVATLLSVIGKEALEVFNTFTWTRSTDAQKVKEVLKKFEEYCTPKKNLTYERYKFNTRNQHYNESIDEFVTSLKCLASSCNFEVLKESLITDRIVLGVQDQRLRESFLRESDLNLNKAIDMAKATERANFESKAIRNESEEVNRIKQDSQFMKQNKKVSCRYCGSSHVMNREKCPAFGRKCFKCKKNNHFANVCRATVSNEDINVVKENGAEELYIE